MSDKVSISCPSCHKGYSVPTNLGNRKLKCKACGSNFQLSDVLPPPVIPATPTPVPVPVGQYSTFDSALGTGGIAGSNPYDQLSPPPGLGQIEYRQIEHRKNSKMLLAIVGSIVVCILIIPACYAINIAIMGTFMKAADQRLNQKKDVSADQSDPSTILVAAKWPQQSPASLSWKSE